MHWLKKLRPQKQSNEYYARLLLRSLFMRNSNPKNVRWFTSLLDKGYDPRYLVDDITQNKEYLDMYRPPPKVSYNGGPCVWNDSAYAAYTNGAEIKSILLIKADHIGDFLLTLDAFSVFRTAFPSASITLLCGPWNEQLAKSLGVFDGVETIEFYASRPDAAQPSFAPDKIGKLADVHFDLAVDLRMEPDTRLLLDHLNATYKCGYASNCCQSSLTVNIPQPNGLQIDNIASHRRMTSLSLARNVVDFFRSNAECSAETLRKKFAGTAESKFSPPAGKPLITMQPFSGRVIKNWPVENFMKLASWLAAEMDASVILLGAKNDTEDMSAISEACQSSNLKSAIGETSLQEAISIISKAVLHIGSDSGLTHVAARMDIPTVAIYSGVAPIELWAPYGRHVTIIATPVECSPCYLSAVEDCQNDHKCVRSTDFEFVRSQVRKQLSR